MRYSLCLHHDAEQDLESLWGTDEEAAARITVRLEHLKADQSLLDALTIQDFGNRDGEPFHVTRWIEQQRNRRNLWRLKEWDLERQGLRYRVVYTLDPRISRYYVLGVINRDFNYESTDPRTQRIIDAYDQLDIPTY